MEEQHLQLLLVFLIPAKSRKQVVKNTTNVVSSSDDPPPQKKRKKKKRIFSSLFNSINIHSNDITPLNKTSTTSTCGKHQHTSMKMRYFQSRYRNQDMRDYGKHDSEL